VSLRKALESGRREALEALAADVADEIDKTANPRDLVALRRVFLATVAALEAMDAAALRLTRDRIAAAGGASVESADGGVDELLARRRVRRGAR